MPRRAFGLILLAALTLLGVAILATGGGPGPAVATGAAVPLALAPAGPVPHVPGAWAAIATFPAVVVSPTPIASPLQIKRAAAVAYPPNGNIYLLGGRHGVDGADVPLQWIWEYAPGTNSWTQKTALLDGLAQGSRYTANMAAAVLTDANGVRIYAVGGSSIDSVPTSVTRVYDPVGDALTMSDAWPASPARVPGGWAVYNNKLYLFGGFSALANGGAGGVFTDTWAFDPLAAAGAKWTQLASANLNLGRGYMAGIALDGYIYAIGGDTWNPSTKTLVPVPDVERLDPSQANPTWVPVAALPTARGDLGAWAADTGTPSQIAGQIAVAGGPWGAPDAQGYLYSPGPNSWTGFPSMLHATRDYGFAQLNGMLYALGGYDYSNSLPSGANFNQSYDATFQGTPTPTVTGTPPTATRTSTVTNTPTVTPTPCLGPNAIGNGGFETGALAPWVAAGGNPNPTIDNTHHHTGTYSALLGTLSGGEPTGDSILYQQIMVPASGGTLSYWYFPLTTDTITFDWQDAYITDTSGNILATIMHLCVNDGVWENQTFNMAPYAGQTVRVEFLVHQDGFGDLTSMNVDDVTLQQPTTCGTATVTVTRSPTAGPTSTATVPAPTNTATTTVVPSNTATMVPSSTATVLPSSTTQPSRTATPSATPCALSFTDVHATDYFYTPVLYLACHGVISGYNNGDGTFSFRPYNNTTRSQMVKIVVLGYNKPIVTPAAGNHTFADVLPANPFFAVIETAARDAIVSGYTCGGPNEPCDSANRPYFRPYNNVTRGQLAKIDVVAAGWEVINPALGSFEDVLPGTAFYTFVETAVCHGVNSGYNCGGPGEPCDSQNRPYYRQYTNATRGQIAKIVYNSLSSQQTCGGPTATPGP